MGAGENAAGTDQFYDSKWFSSISKEIMVILTPAVLH